MRRPSSAGRSLSATLRRSFGSRSSRGASFAALALRMSMGGGRAPPVMRKSLAESATSFQAPDYHTGDGDEEGAPGATTQPQSQPADGPDATPPRISAAELAMTRMRSSSGAVPRHRHSVAGMTTMVTKKTQAAVTHAASNTLQVVAGAKPATPTAHHSTAASLTAANLMMRAASGGVLLRHSVSGLPSLTFQVPGSPTLRLRPAGDASSPPVAPASEAHNDGADVSGGQDVGMGKPGAALSPWHVAVVSKEGQHAVLGVLSNVRRASVIGEAPPAEAQGQVKGAGAAAAASGRQMRLLSAGSAAGSGSAEVSPRSTHALLPGAPPAPHLAPASPQAIAASVRRERLSTQESHREGASPQGGTVVAGLGGAAPQRSSDSKQGEQGGEKQEGCGDVGGEEVEAVAAKDVPAKASPSIRVSEFMRDTAQAYVPFTYGLLRVKADLEGGGAWHLDGIGEEVEGEVGEKEGGAGSVEGDDLEAFWKKVGVPTRSNPSQSQALYTLGDSEEEEGVGVGGSGEGDEPIVPVHYLGYIRDRQERRKMEAERKATGALAPRPHSAVPVASPKVQAGGPPTTLAAMQAIIPDPLSTVKPDYNLYLVDAQGLPLDRKPSPRQQNKSPKPPPSPASPARASAASPTARALQQVQLMAAARSSTPNSRSRSSPSISTPASPVPPALAQPTSQSLTLGYGSVPGRGAKGAFALQAAVSTLRPMSASPTHPAMARMGTRPSTLHNRWEGEGGSGGAGEGRRGGEAMRGILGKGWWWLYGWRGAVCVGWVH